ncbi:NUDIX hydrolase [Microlunatus soli]|uniref:ADP-ribose pyrophosphatase YjhB, NUDIX family n=1 Tax=Microlunatus soli TaxID=630515 RepID=A0A1H2A6Y9_9ACTN|nr:NUDIX hydrolase [Microlunatus soli]SDT41738.1 ADP-ribose pyrophosphatase YjhB, NUDIX family [Microlunatus soli]
MYQWETSVVLIRNDQDEVLLVGQNYGLRFFGLPGGKIESDEDPADAAVRELREETGLTTATVTPIGSYELLYPRSGARYRAHAFRADEIWGEPTIDHPDEISSIGWYRADRLPEPLTPSARAVLSPDAPDVGLVQRHRRAR